VLIGEPHMRALVLSFISRFSQGLLKRNKVATYFSRRFCTIAVAGLSFVLTLERLVISAVWRLQVVSHRLGFASLMASYRTLALQAATVGRMVCDVRGTPCSRGTPSSEAGRLEFLHHREI